MHWACPGCGADEGSYHKRGCKAVGIGVRPCCRSRVFLDHFDPHETTCPEWGANPIYAWQLPDLGGDPWRDVTYAREG